jgi:hypothetical protein
MRAPRLSYGSVAGEDLAFLPPTLNTRFVRLKSRPYGMRVSQ